jgi:site-specific DNA-cytosine methylase
LTNEFFVKNRRAQNDDDYESWASTTVAATLNGFDNTGSVRATTLIIFYGNRVDDVRFQKDVINTLQARMGTGGNNMPMVLIEETDMQKDQNIVGTLQARDYKGVGNQYVEENKLVVTYPIQDGREMEKDQNGMGVGDETSPSYTLDQTGAQAVAYSIREDATANTFSATEIDKARALQSLQPSPQSHHAQTFIVQAYDEYNDAVAETHHTLRAGTKQSTGVIESLAFHIKQTPVSGAVSPALGTTSEGMGYMSAKSTVRRLTPTECERLQGFPDGWTEGQSDSSRYKQMGNAVAVPVVEWLIGRLVTEHMES